MERTKTTNPNDDRIRWKKVGGGSARLTINGVKRIIKPGEIFYASPKDIPEGCRDVVRALESFKEVKESKLNVQQAAYTIIPRGKSRSLFDVIDSKGKTMTEAAVTRDVAEKFKKSLEK